MKKLELNKMEKVEGGVDASCKAIADGLGGASIIFGAASWWTGAGAGFALTLSIVAYGVSLSC